MPKLQGGLVWSQGFGTSGGQFRGTWSPKSPALMDDDQAHLRTLALRCGMGVQVLSVVRVRHLGCDRTRFPCLLTNADCPQSRMPPLLLPPELPLIRSGVCSDSVCEEPLRRARQFAQALGPGGGQRWSLRGGGAATQTASVGLGGRRTVASQTMLFANNQP